MQKAFQQIIIWSFIEINSFSAVQVELLQLFRQIAGDVFDVGIELALGDEVIDFAFVHVRIVDLSEPGEFTLLEVDHDVGQRLEVVSSALLHHVVGVDGGKAAGAHKM